MTIHPRTPRSRDAFLAACASVAMYGCGSASQTPAPASTPPVAALPAPSPPPPPVLPRQIKSEHSLIAPTAVAPYALVADAIRIDGRDVPLAGTGPRDAIAHGLARVPPELRAIVRSLTISAVDNPTDEAWAAKYRMPVRAGMSANADGEIEIYPYGLLELRDESFFVKNLLHEIGHAWSLRAWRDDSRALSAWLAAIAKDPGVPSQYAQGSFRASGSPAEDAAEATALYFIVRGTPDEERYRAQMPARFALIAARFPPRAR